MVLPDPNGFTLDPGFRAAVGQGLTRGRRLLLSITALAQSGGSTPVYGPGPDRPMARNALGIYPEVCDGPDQVRAAARRATPGSASSSSRGG